MSKLSLEDLLEKHILNLNKFKYNNVKVGNQVAYHLAIYLNNKKYKKCEIKTKLKYLYNSIKNFSFVAKYSCDKSYNNKFLFSFFRDNRNDYQKFLKSIFNQFNNYEKEMIKKNSIKYKIKLFNPKLIKKLNLRGIYNYLKYEGFDIFFILYVVSIIYQYSFFIDDFTKNVKKQAPIAYISFCDAHFIENIITQILKNLNVLTFTLQHGVYFYYKEELQNQNILVYKNFISDYMLVWGEYTISQLMIAGISKKRLIVAGNPLYNHLSNKSNIKSVQSKCILILLSQELYYESNLKMLNILNTFCEEYNFTYKVKLHPHNDLKKYQSKVNSKCIGIIKNEVSSQELIKDSNLIVLHSTTLYIDALLLKKIVFRYNDKYSLPFDILNDKFSNYDEFIQLYDKRNEVNYEESLNKFIFLSKENQYSNVIKKVLDKN